MSRPRLPTLAVFAVLLLTYGYFIRSARDENSNSRLGLIFAVAREGRLTIDSFHQHPWLHTIDKAYHGGHYYSDKAPGTAVLGVLAYAPVYHAARALGLDTDTWSAFSRTKYFFTAIQIDRAGIQSILGPSPFYDQCLAMLKRGEYTDNLGRRAGLVNAASLAPLIAAWFVTTVVAARSDPGAKRT